MPGRGHAPVPVRAELLHLRREHPVHPGRGVLVLAQPLVRAALPGRVGPRAPHRPATGPWPPCSSPSPCSATCCPALFAAAGAVVWLLLDADVVRGVRSGVGGGRLARRRWSRRLAWSVVAGAIGVGLSAWWLLPFATGQAYTTNMGYTKVLGFPHLLFPASARWVLAADVVGLVAMVVRRNRVAPVRRRDGRALGRRRLPRPGQQAVQRPVPALLVPLPLPPGRLRPGRGGVGRGPLEPPAPPRTSGWRSSGGRLGAVARDPVAARGPDQPVPPTQPHGGSPPVRWSVRWWPWPRRAWPWCRPWSFPPPTLSHVGVTVGADQPSAWADWNYSGYERKPDYPEYHAVIQMMAKVGAAPGLWPGHVGVRPLAQPVRHHHVADAAAVLDQRLRRLDGRTALRVGLVDAVPLHQPERAVGQSVQRRGRTALRRPQRPPRDRAPPADGGEVLPGRVDHGRDGGRRRPQPHRGRVHRTVAHQLQRRGARHHLEGLRGGRFGLWCSRWPTSRWSGRASRPPRRAGWPRRSAGTTIPPGGTWYPPPTVRRPGRGCR